MPRTIQEILAQADDLTKRFETSSPDDGDGVDGRSLREVREAFDDVATGQQRLVDAVTVARGEGHSWAAIGAMVGTTGEAARQRYGKAVVPKRR